MENKDKFIKYDEIKIEPTENQIKAYLKLRNHRNLRLLQEKIMKEQEEKKKDQSQGE